MNRYIVEYQAGLKEPFHFACEADNHAHAIEQTKNAYPGVTVIAVFVEMEQVTRRRPQRTNMWTNVNATNPHFKTRGY